MLMKSLKHVLYRSAGEEQHSVRKRLPLHSTQNLKGWNIFGMPSNYLRGHGQPISPVIKDPGSRDESHIQNVCASY
jgi:hypothetical protein